MRVGQKFNTLTFEEYVYYIDNHKKCKDFNVLGLYRSIIENKKLTIAEKVTIRKYCHRKFRKAFDFLQLKDPFTFVAVEYLGQELTKGDENRIWENIREQQKSILQAKKINHRNFGEYSKHNCGYADCPYNGIMVRQGTWLAEGGMHFNGDRNKYQQMVKSEKRKLNRKKEKQIIDKELKSE